MVTHIFFFFFFSFREGIHSYGRWILLLSELDASNSWIFTCDL